MTVMLLNRVTGVPEPRLLATTADAGSVPARTAVTTTASTSAAAATVRH
jgi:hypothetical protein